MLGNEGERVGEKVASKERGSGGATRFSSRECEPLRSSLTLSKNKGAKRRTSSFASP